MDGPIIKTSTLFGFMLFTLNIISADDSLSVLDTKDEENKASDIIMKIKNKYVTVVLNFMLLSLELYVKINYKIFNTVMVAKFLA